MPINKIVFIGAGNMSGAIIDGMIASGVEKSKIHTTNRSQEKRAYWAEKGLNAHIDNHEAIKNADVIVLGVKPNMMSELLSDIAAEIPRNAVVITVAAGVPYRNYRHFLTTQAIIRTMPNTPCLVGTGVVGVFYGENATSETRNVVKTLFEPIALIHECQTEAEIDLVIAAAGSAPAYFFLFVESIINAATSLGLDQDSAEKMVKQTALGAAKMLTESSTDHIQLRRNVTSPGGTTHEAITRFQKDGLGEITHNAMSDCIARAQEMAEQLTLKENKPS